jgi:transcriptional regulator with GAF, ATPase, and Fis domain
MESRRATVLVRDHAVLVRQFEVTVVDGVDRGKRAVSSSDELSVGTAEGNDLQLTDPSVSRHHCALHIDERGLELRDLGSRNGTLFGTVELVRCYVQTGIRVRIGQTTLAVDLLDRDIEQPIAATDRFGPLLGGSPAMRRLYPLLEQCGRSAATVLVQGETGTGKELVAEAIHGSSDRRDGPFMVIDCGALSHDLAESELFGHVEGAFTGADAARTGAFEAADGGTVFLDEIGELPLTLQPLLLRALENRTIRRVGSNRQRPVDVRVIAASHRDLRELVNAKRFRADLYYRLHVIRIVVPPLRERAGDVALLAAHYWRALRSDPIPDAFVAQLGAQSWPGNVRELRNAVERASQLGWSPQRVPVVAERPSYGEAKARALAEWEAGWVEELMRAHGGNLSAAARAARMGRSNLREIARRHGVATGASAGEPDVDEPDEPDADEPGEND